MPTVSHVCSSNNRASSLPCVSHVCSPDLDFIITAELQMRNSQLLICIWTVSSFEALPARSTANDITPQSPGEEKGHGQGRDSQSTSKTLPIKTCKLFPWQQMENSPDRVKNIWAFLSTQIPSSIELTSHTDYSTRSAHHLWFFRRLHLHHPPHPDLPHQRCWPNHPCLLTSETEQHHHKIIM